MNGRGGGGGGGKRFGGGGGKRFGGGGGKRFGGGGGRRFGGPRSGGESRGEGAGGPPREGGKRFGGPKRGFGDRPGAGAPAREGFKGKRFGGPKRSFGDRPGGEGGPPREGGFKGKRFGGPKRGFGDRPQGGAGFAKKRFDGSQRGGGGSSFPKRRGTERTEGGDQRRFPGGDRRGFEGDRRGPSTGWPPDEVVDQVTTAPPAASTTRFVFGVNPALEALRARPQEIERLYYADGSMNPSVAGEILSRARDAQVRIDQVPREKLTAYADGGVHQGVVLELREFQYAELEELTKAPGLVVVLDSLQDPQNVGAIIRSANAFGARGVVLAKDRAAAITGAVVKASAGATEHTKIVRVTNLSRALEQLKEAGYWTVAADPEGDPLGTKKLDGPLAVVIGAEGPGVRQGVLSHCDFKVRIPMLGDVASLNASVSAGILLYEIVRQRGVPRES